MAAPRAMRDPYSYGLMAKDVIGAHGSSQDRQGLDRRLERRRHHRPRHRDELSADRLDRLFAFGANTNVAGLKPNIDKDPTFAKYIENAGKDYERLSKTPKEFDAFVTQISQMWATQPDYKPEQLAKITSPVAIADGEHDEAISQEHNVEMSKAIPGAKLVILPGLSHFAMLQDPKHSTRRCWIS